MGQQHKENNVVVLANPQLPQENVLRSTYTDALGPMKGHGPFKEEKLLVNALEVTLFFAKRQREHKIIP